MPPFVSSGTPRTRFRDKIKKRPDLPRILTEGDSWFAFPLPERRNIIDQLIDLNDTNKAAWLRLESNGDTIEEMMSGRQWANLVDVVQEFRQPANHLQLILISAGGNDVVGRLEPLLDTKRPGMSWEDCLLTAKIDERMQQIEAEFLRLISLRDQWLPDCPILTHTYDYAIPQDKPVRLLGLIPEGPWMWPALLKKNIKAGKDQRAVVRFLIDRFADLATSLADAHGNLIVVDTRGTLEEDEWGDEIHPTNRGFEKVMRRFLPELNRLFPAHFPPA